MSINVYIGFDHREPEAYEVCKYSILKHSPNANVFSLNHKGLRKMGLFRRRWLIDEKGGFEDIEDKRPFSTEFAFTRFLIPFIQRKGWALFCDCDMLFTSNLEELFSLADPSKALMVVKHDYTPKDSIKMDGCAQEAYSRKNWSSVILWNCEHEANKRLSVYDVNTQSGRWLHNFSWLKDDEIGELPETWNWLEGHNKKPLHGLPKNIHYTRGGAWFKEYMNVDYANEWLATYGEMKLYQNETN